MHSADRSRDDLPVRGTPGYAEFMALTLAQATSQLIGPGQPFEIGETEIRGVVTRFWKNCPPTLRSILELSNGFGEATFLVYEDERMTFSEHFTEAAAFARVLAERHGVVAGDRVAIVMRNYPEWVVSFWAAAALGAVIVPLNAWWTGAELAYGLEDSGSKVAVVDAERLARVLPHLRELRASGLENVVVVRPEDARDAVEVPASVERYTELMGGSRGNAAELPAVAIDTDDNATIFYTSGTTGKPKGALGTQRNICTNLLSLGFIAAPRPDDGSGCSRAGGAIGCAELLPVVGTAVPCDRLSLRPRGEHRQRRQARDDAPLEPRACLGADRAGADHYLRGCPHHGAAGAQLARVCESLHFKRQIGRLRRGARPAGDRQAHQAAIPRRKCLKWLWAHGDLVGDEYEHWRRLRP